MRKNFPLFALSAVGLVVLFIKPLYGLARLAVHDSLYSHIPLIPCVTGYLLWKDRSRFANKTSTSPWAAALCILVGLAALATWVLNKGTLVEIDYLSLTIFAFVSFVCAIYLLVLGRNIFNADGFPFAFLLFMVPFPVFLTNGIETFFQHASASAAYALLELSNAPVYRQGLEFRLPNIVLSVAPECSGIRSTLVLFMTSLIAGHLFLESPWKKWVLTLFVIPLAILRNGFRIFTIAQLCIHRGPEMIDSAIHKRGGPIFFVISLVPFFLLLFFLRKSSFGRKRSTGF